MAEFIFKKMVAEKGIADQFEIDSVATDGYNEIVHVGIDWRAKGMLHQMNVPFTEHYSRRIRPKDYTSFDYILCMDDANVEDVQSIVGSDKDNKIRRLLDFTEQPRNIKDPWYTDNFDDAYWDICHGCKTFLESIQKEGVNV